MSDLQKVLDNILNDKGVNLTPENLKQGITCLGILGDLEEKIKVFASEEDLFNSSDNQINDLAAVLTQEFTDSPRELFNVVNFPYVNGLWENPYYEGFYSKWLITNGEVEIGYIILTETTTEIDINYGKHFHVEYTKTSSSSREDGTEDGGMWDRTKFVLIENDIETDISGVEEYENKDFTRVDCLTDTHAVEFDFANKWHESIGQALHYSVMTGKRAKVVLILDEPKAQMTYFKRIKRIGKRYNFDTEYVTNDILSINNEDKCLNAECKCNKTR